MPKQKLTDVSVRALNPPPKGQVTYWDEGLECFGVRVSQGGTKSFVTYFSSSNKWTTIGRYPVLSLKEARTEAKRLIAENTLGKVRPAHISFDEAKRLFLEASAQKNKPRTTADYRRLLNSHFRFGKKRLAELGRHDILRKIDRLKDTPTEQNHAFVAARTLLRWAVRNEYLDGNPLEGLSPPAKLAPRDRVLSNEELATVYKAARAYPYPYGPIVSLLLLTGQRRGEIAALQWDWIDADNQTITLPASLTKNKHKHTFPYGYKVAEVIEEVPEIGDYLFPARRERVRGKPTTIFNGWGKEKSLFDATLEDVASYRLHDLRRSFSSHLASLGTPIHVTEKLLNHVSGEVSGIRAVYNRYSYLPECKEAVAAFERHLDTLCNS